MSGLPPMSGLGTRLAFDAHLTRGARSDEGRRGIAAAGEVRCDEATKHGLVLAHYGADAKKKFNVVVIVPNDHIGVAREQEGNERLEGTSEVVAGAVEAVDATFRRRGADDLHAHLRVG